MEGLPVYVIISATIVAVPLVVVCKVVGGAVMPCVLVGVRYSAARSVIALGVGAGAVLVVVRTATTPYTILQCRALEVLVIGVKLLAFVAADGVREGAAVGTVAWGGFVVELGHVGNAYVVL